MAFNYVVVLEVANKHFSLTGIPGVNNRQDWVLYIGPDQAAATRVYNETTRTPAQEEADENWEYYIKRLLRVPHGEIIEGLTNEEVIASHQF